MPALSGGSERIGKAKKIKWEKKSGILFLPNHPAHVDPVLLSLILWPLFRVRPLVVENVYRQSGIHTIMKMVRALSIPNLETSLNDLKIAKAKEVVEEVMRGLEKGENFLLYPSGRLKLTGKEILGGASAAHNIVESCPEAHLVLIRTTGLWGSSFSRAYAGRSFEFKKTLAHDLWKLLLNGIFFMPRRNVCIEIEPAGVDFPFKSSRLAFNRYLESWYNRYPVEGKVVDAEPLYRVSYLFWKKDYLEGKKEEKESRLSKKVFSSQTEEEVFSELERICPHTEISPKMDLATDLGMDSLDIAEIIAFLSLRYEVGEIHPESLKTVQDILEVAEGKKKREIKQGSSTFHWAKEKGRPFPILPEGKTIPEAFFSVSDQMEDCLACADDLMGPISYRKLKMGVIALAKEFSQIEGDSVGVLLPSSVVVYMVILALMLAKKVPVLLNWTLGPRYLNHMMELANFQKVISSWQFLERISNVEFGNIAKTIVYLEDLKKEISFMDKLTAFFLSTRKTSYLLKHFDLTSLRGNDCAVILFTSGTEAAPKGVPLSHQNILANQRAALKSEQMQKEDVFYGILPPFHSFGFSVVGLLPILSGIRVVYAPDPTDSFALAEGIERWGVTVFCSAPSFLKGLLQAASKKQLKSVRLFVTGAEKASADLFRKVALMGNGAPLIEGYGITECAPMISINRPCRPTKGVGQLLEGVEAITVHPETKKPLQMGEEGEICIRGENVFSGYLGKEKSPFLRIDGKEWYATGDLGFLDNGYLILSGRLKRFAKIGGEMISLTGLEDVLMDALEEGEDQPTIAVCSKEKEGDKSLLVLFTTKELEKERVNKILKDAGFSRLVKIAEIKKIEQIPLMAAGKIDYRFLQSLIE